MSYLTPMMLAAVVVACIFVQFNRMLNAEARERAKKRQLRDAQRQAFGLRK